jgi:hypothetical protein
MWGEFHKLRTSDAFTEEWDKFIRASVQQKALPAFFQYIFKPSIPTSY